MVLTESQWRRIKRIRWDKKQSRRIRSSVHDDKLIVGWDSKSKRWHIARLIDATIQIKFGVRTIPTKEVVPYTWKVWEDDDGSYLHIGDPRLIPYVQRCDLWRTGAQKYMLKFEHDDWLEEQRDRSDDDNLLYLAKQAYSRVKAQSDSMCGYVSRSPVERKWHVPQSWKPYWEKTHDKVVECR